MRCATAGLLSLFGAAVAAGMLLAQAPSPEAGGTETTPRVRTFRFHYAATITQLPPGKQVRVWLPLPPKLPEQEVTVDGKDLPAKGKPGIEPTYGNQMLYLEPTADRDGKVTLKLTFRVTRREVRAGTQGFAKPGPGQDLSRFLQADALVPIGGKPLELLKDRTLPADAFGAARVLYDVVNQHMRYSKEGIGWGRGDVVWVCDSKYGNCTDFHSLFISLARSHKIPAKFEIGFPMPPERGAGKVGGYHCWAWFLPEGKGWVPVDISEANRNPKLREYYFGNLTEDRVTFTTGRDLDLVPRQAGPPLNYFIYPHVEVDGQPYPAERVVGSFSYEDVAGTTRK